MKGRDNANFVFGGLETKVLENLQYFCHMNAEIKLEYNESPKITKKSTFHLTFLHFNEKKKTVFALPF